MVASEPFHKECMSLVKILMMVAMASHYDGGENLELPSIEGPPVQELGLASWYGDGARHGDVTANGEVFDPSEFTCAHRTLPFDTVVMIVNRSNRRRVWCRINDRGPYGARMSDGSWGVRTSRNGDGEYRGIIDMSIAAATELGVMEVGLQQVELRYWTRNSGEAFNLAAMDLEYP
jgi:rare lipoprotein A (peptidoglycan hydrolase)